MTKKKSASGKSNINAPAKFDVDKELADAVSPLGEDPNKTAIGQSVSEILFYQTAVPGAVYADAPPEKHRELLYHAHVVLNALEKLNLMVVPVRDLRAERLADKAGMVEIVRSFMANMQKPKDLDKTFPIEEMVQRLIDGRKV